MVKEFREFNEYREIREFSEKGTLSLISLTSSTSLTLFNFIKFPTLSNISLRRCAGIKNNTRAVVGCMCSVGWGEGKYAFVAGIIFNTHAEGGVFLWCVRSFCG